VVCNLRTSGGGACGWTFSLDPESDILPIDTSTRETLAMLKGGAMWTFGAGFPT